MAEPTKTWSAGDEIKASDLNTNFEEALNDYRDFVYGETISAGDAVYLKASDGKVYKTDAGFDDERIHNFVGFAKEDGALDETHKVQVSGIVSGLSGLTTGSLYYLSDTAGAISDTAGTYEKIIGIAVSSTRLLLRPGIEGMLTSKAQTISGVKTFSSIPVLPDSDPTSDNQAVRKKYVDDKSDRSINPDNRLYLSFILNAATYETRDGVTDYGGLFTVSGGYLNSRIFASIGSSYDFRRFSANKIIVIRLWGRFTTTDTVDRDAIGFGLAKNGTTSINDYDNTEESVAFVLYFDSGTSSYRLYAKAADGANNENQQITGITLKNWNEYKIVYEPGVSAKFYVNGELKATLSTYLPSSSTGIDIQLRVYSLHTGYFSPVQVAIEI